jgi:hypothetical protein
VSAASSPPPPPPFAVSVVIFGLDIVEFPPFLDDPGVAVGFDALTPPAPTVIV